MWNGETLEPDEDLLLFQSFGLVYYEEVSIRSIYIEEDKLYFDINWNGNADSKVMDHIEPEFAIERTKNEDDIIEAIEHLIEILKQ
jgi:hypothetical protein